MQLLSIFLHSLRSTRILSRMCRICRIFTSEAMCAHTCVKIFNFGQTVYDRCCFQTNVAVVKITDREIPCLFIIWTCQEYFFFAICLNGFYNVWPLMETGCWGLKPNIYKEQHSVPAFLCGRIPFFTRKIIQCQFLTCLQIER